MEVKIRKKIENQILVTFKNLIKSLLKKSS